VVKSTGAGQATFIGFEYLAQSGQTAIALNHLIHTHPIPFTPIDLDLADKKREETEAKHITVSRAGVGSAVWCSFAGLVRDVSGL